MLQPLRGLLRYLVYLGQRIGQRVGHHLQGHARHHQFARRQLVRLVDLHLFKRHLRHRLAQPGQGHRSPSAKPPRLPAALGHGHRKVGRPNDLSHPQQRQGVGRLLVRGGHRQTTGVLGHHLFQRAHGGQRTQPGRNAAAVAAHLVFVGGVGLKPGDDDFRLKAFLLVPAVGAFLPIPHPVAAVRRRSFPVQPQASARKSFGPHLSDGYAGLAPPEAAHLTVAPVVEHIERLAIDQTAGAHLPGVAAAGHQGRLGHAVNQHGGRSGGLVQRNGGLHGIVRFTIVRPDFYQPEVVLGLEVGVGATRVAGCPLKGELLRVAGHRVRGLFGQVEQGRVVAQQPGRSAGGVRDHRSGDIVQHLHAEGVQAFGQLGFALPGSAQAVAQQVLGLQVGSQIVAIEAQRNTHPDGLAQRQVGGLGFQIDAAAPNLPAQPHAKWYRRPPEKRSGSLGCARSGSSPSRRRPSGGRSAPDCCREWYRRPRPFAGGRTSHSHSSGPRATPQLRLPETCGRSGCRARNSSRCSPRAASPTCRWSECCSG